MTTTSSQQPTTGFFNTKRGRIVLENLTAYAFLAPAGLLILLFGIFPVAFAFFVSLHRWRRFPDEYVGLSNYERALGNFGYILFFWLAILAFVAGIYLIRRVYATMRDSGNGWRDMPHIVSGIVVGYVTLLAMDWIGRLIPVIMDIPRQVRGQNTSLDLFMSELGKAFEAPETLQAGNLVLLGLIVAIGVSLLLATLFRSKSTSQIILLTGSATVLIIGSVFIMQLTVTEIQTVIAEARESGEELPIWSQLVFVTGGLILMGVAWKIFQQGIKTFDNRRFILMIFGGITLAIGGYLIMAELPNALAEADDDLLQGFWVTVMYAFGTVPVQLSIGLVLAYFLFQPIRFRGFFRMVYFIPYITPFVATSIIFRIIFNGIDSSPANRLIGIIGIEPQRWILERSTIGELLGLPEFLAGPSLALIVIMIYSAWTYIGYDAVIFLAGLGNIPGELYEAAKIDGASGWRIFRHITLPLLSPTIFFLSLVAIIGTFQAFTQIWILRTNAVGSTVNTASVFIFDELQNSNRYGYASSMAFVLFAVILLMTLFQNRIMGRRVFYG